MLRYFLKKSTCKQTENLCGNFDVDKEKRFHTDVLHFRFATIASTNYFRKRKGRPGRCVCAYLVCVPLDDRELLRSAHT